MKRIVGIGSGGHAKVLLDILRQEGTYQVVGLLDADPTRHGQSVLGVPVLGDDELLPHLYQEGVHLAFLGLAGTGDNAPRQRLYMMVRQLGYEVPIILHPTAVVASSVRMSQGCQVLAGAIVNSGAILGDNVIVNTGAIVEHDCVIGAHVHIATGARLASTVHVGEGTHIGLGASVRQCTHIGRNAVVGAGAVVVDNVPGNVVVVGVPARILRRV